MPRELSNASDTVAEAVAGIRCRVPTRRASCRRGAAARRSCSRLSSRDFSAKIGTMHHMGGEGGRGYPS
eukprot:scaffold3051_cov112-Isochrysis_galbana.AAC.1